MIKQAHEVDLTPPVDLASAYSKNTLLTVRENHQLFCNNHNDNEIKTPATIMHNSCLSLVNRNCNTNIKSCKKS